MTDDAAFLSAIQANPNDELARLVYADWLDEKGDRRGGYLRAECELAAIAEPTNDQRASLKRTAEGIPSDWIAAVSRGPIELCVVRFEFECPKRWESLPATDEAGVRFCDTCNRSVYFCDSVELARRVGDRGQCVAVHAALTRSRDDLASSSKAAHMLMGAIMRPDLPAPSAPPISALRRVVARLFGRPTTHSNDLDDFIVGLPRSVPEPEPPSHDR